MRRFAGLFSTLAVFAFLSSSCNQDKLDPDNQEPGTQTETEKDNPNNVVTELHINVPGNIEITSKDYWTEGAEIFLVDREGNRTSLGKTSLKRRGNSSFFFPKDSYNLKFEVKLPVLGMPASKRWCLLAQWMDKTNLRNDVAFEISRRFDRAWTPRGRFVKLYYNGENRGLYYLVEKVKIAKNRVNISDDGYIVDLDSNYDEPYKFRSSYYNLPVNFKDPDEDLMTQEKFDYFQDYFNEVERRIKTKDASYLDMIDLDSFISWVLVQEVVGNGEYKHPKSTIMYKDVEGKLFAGPVWDFDWGTFVPDQKDFIVMWRHWYEDLAYDKTFYARFKEIWNATKGKLKDIDKYIDARADVISEAAIEDAELWPIDQDENGDEKLSFDEAIQRMKDSFNERLAELDDYIYNMY